MAVFEVEIGDIKEFTNNIFFFIFKYEKNDNSWVAECWVEKQWQSYQKPELRIKNNHSVMILAFLKKVWP